MGAIVALRKTFVLGQDILGQKIVLTFMLKQEKHSFLLKLNTYLPGFANRVLKKEKRILTSPSHPALRLDSSISAPELGLDSLIVQLEHGLREEVAEMERFGGNGLLTEMRFPQVTKLQKLILFPEVMCFLITLSCLLILYVIYFTIF